MELGIEEGPTLMDGACRREPRRCPTSWQLVGAQCSPSASPWVSALLSLHIAETLAHLF